MSVANYGDLKSSVIRMISRIDRLPEDYERYTLFAESRFNRTLRAQEMITNVPAFAATGRYTNLPAGFLEIERIVFLQGGSRVLPEYLTGEQAAAYDYADDGPACWYSIRGGQIEIIPDTDVTIDLHYYAALPTITGNDADTNWLLTSDPDLYVFAVAMESAIDMQDNARMKIYSDRYALALREFKSGQMRKRFGHSMRPRNL